MRLRHLPLLLAFFFALPLLYASKQAARMSIGGISVPASGYAQTMIQKYINQYTTNFGKQELYLTFDVAEPYRLYVRQELKRLNLPSALEYLPFVESAYKPLATSRSGARGLWQFMENSIVGLLHKDAWIDERLDPWLSTDAALKKLKDNYAMFKDWPLAIAAYNCGAGAMRSILKKSPQKSFWYISEKGLLRDQSVQYVPKLLAICELAEHGSKYNIALPALSTTLRYAEFDYLRIKGLLHLNRLESELRMESGTLTKLNPALIHACTPPDREYKLRLPSGMLQAAMIAIADIQAEARAMSPREHIVCRGETLYGIARRYECTVSALCEFNNIDKNDILSVGKILYIPTKTSETK